MLSGKVVVLYAVVRCKALQGMDDARAFSPPVTAELFVKVALPSMLTRDREL